ncbi:VOC family protein [Reyranella sp. CPCC 100927]|uniref:VOC family protein n=1 Tax=Reyranella sp. CPCC 100927 TaxID=2599616 RepID=UPI0011B6EA32|nr:VOC family protein [Reyranella sp. CPCC 100927]TWT05988.1 VOC family protein [Reyranella sp. CPCC 100927]
MAIHELYPYLRAKSAEEAIAFYIKAFGAVEKFRLVETGGRIGHAELAFGDAVVMISDEFPEYDCVAPKPGATVPILLHIHVDDADAVIQAAVDAGGRIVRPAQDHFHGERSGLVRDPFGYDWLIGHTLEQVEPDEMQRRYTKQD